MWEWGLMHTDMQAWVCKEWVMCSKNSRSMDAEDEDEERTVNVVLLISTWIYFVWCTYELWLQKKTEFGWRCGIHFRQAHFTTLAVPLCSCIHWFTGVDL